MPGDRSASPLCPPRAGLLPDSDRLAVEVELHARPADRLGDKLRRYRDAAGYAGVLWPTHREGGRRPLEPASAEAGCAELMGGEPLPDACRAYVWGAGGGAAARGRRSPTDRAGS